MSVVVPDPTACARSTNLTPSTPYLGAAQRCPDCGHGYANHGSYHYCDLCRLQVQLDALRAHLGLDEPGPPDEPPPT